MEEHRLLRAGVVVPLVERGHVDRGELPLLERVRLALPEPAALLLARHREPELDQVDAAPHEVPLELRRLAHELVVLGIGAEAHHPLDTRAVVPGAIHQHDLAARGQVLHVALEVPLAALLLGRLLERDDARAPRVQVLHEALDRPALARRVAALEQDHDPLAGVLGPRLQLQQLDLQPVLLPLVVPAQHQPLVRVAAVAPVVGELLVGVRRLRCDTGHAVAQALAQPRGVVGRCAGEHRLDRAGEALDVVAGRALDDVVDRGGLRELRGRDRLADRVALEGDRREVRRDVAVRGAARRAGARHDVRARDRARGTGRFGATGHGGRSPQDRRADRGSAPRIAPDPRQGRRGFPEKPP